MFDLFHMFYSIFHVLQCMFDLFYMFTSIYFIDVLFFVGLHGFIYSTAEEGDRKQGEREVE